MRLRRPQEDTAQASALDTHAAISAALSAALSGPPPQQASIGSSAASGTSQALLAQLSAGLRASGPALSAQPGEPQLGSSPQQQQQQQQQQRQNSAPSPLHGDRCAPLLLSCFGFFPAPSPARSALVTRQVSAGFDSVSCLLRKGGQGACNLVPLEWTEQGCVACLQGDVTAARFRRRDARSGHSTAAAGAGCSGR
jgi:hypothetical protein